MSETTGRFPTQRVSKAKRLYMAWHQESVITYPDLDPSLHDMRLRGCKDTRPRRLHPYISYIMHSYMSLSFSIWLYLPQCYPDRQQIYIGVAKQLFCVIDFFVSWTFFCTTIVCLKIFSYGVLITPKWLFNIQIACRNCTFEFYSSVV